MLSIITLDESEKWDKIVKSFLNFDVNYLSGYARAFWVHRDGEPLLFYYEDGNTRAINVVMKRDIAAAEPFRERLPPNTWYDLSTPYGYGGFLIEGSGYENVNAAYNAYCLSGGFVSEFVRFHLFGDYQLYFSGLYETNAHNVIRTLDMPLDDMLMDFEHKVRKNLKKAADCGLKVEIDYTGNRLDEFLKIYYGTMDRTGANRSFYFAKDFFETINKMSGNYVYIHILYQEKIISTELVLYGNENCYSFLGGTDCAYFDLRPSDFLKYEIIKWAKEKGLKRYVLGGGYGGDDGIFKFKKSFAPNGILDFYVGKRIFADGLYKELVEMRREDKDFNEKTSYFPAYRG